MRSVKRIAVAALVCTIGALGGVPATAVAAPTNDVREAANELKKALDADPSLSPALKAAMKKFVSSLENSPGTLEPSSEMKQAFARKLDRWFEDRKDDLPKDAVLGTYKHGFRFGTPDGQFKLKFGGRIQADFRAFQDGEEADGRTDSFFLRRARFYAAGTLYKDVDFKIQSDFAGAGAVLKDGYIEMKQLGKRAKIRIGQFKQPYSYEELVSSKYIDFVERSLAVDSLTPSRDVGVMVHGKVSNGLFDYKVGIFNGNGSNKKDAGSEKDVAGRVGIHPFVTGDSDLLKGLSFGLNTTYGKQNTSGASKSFKTAADTTFMKLVSFTGADRVRYGADAQWFYGPASIQAEYLSTQWKNAQFGSIKDDLKIHGYYITGTYLLNELFFGDEGKVTKVRNRIKPARDFDPKTGGWGAYELAIRYGRIEADGDPVADGLALPGSSDGASAYTVGINWYLNEMMRFKLNFIHTRFDDAVTLGSNRLSNENTILARMQIEF